MVDYCTKVDKIISSIPELEDNVEARAIVSHVLLNPNILPPMCSEELRSKVVSQIGENPFQNDTSVKYIDLFAGIGGFHQAFSKLGCKCVFSSEWDIDAKKTYAINYGLIPYGDIRSISEKEIPDHDILCAGFPCQPFSIAGVSKKNSMGRATGFEDKTQGTLFFDVARIINEKRPKVFFLENVKNLKSHNDGKTWKVIDSVLNDLNYWVFDEFVDGRNWVPQHRERIFIVGFNKDYFKENPNFRIPTFPSDSYHYKPLSEIITEKFDPSLILSPGTWQALINHKEKHKAKGNGFGYTLLPEKLDRNTVTATISARYYKDGAEILVPVEGSDIPRKLSVQEAMQLQGFNPETFVFPVSKTKAYKQIGNSVVVPAITETAKAILKELEVLEE